MDAAAGGVKEWVLGCVRGIGEEADGDPALQIATADRWTLVVWVGGSEPLVRAGAGPARPRRDLLPLLPPARQTAPPAAGRVPRWPRFTGALSHAPLCRHSNIRTRDPWPASPHDPVPSRSAAGRYPSVTRLVQFLLNMTRPSSRIFASMVI